MNNIELQSSFAIYSPSEFRVLALNSVHSLLCALFRDISRYFLRGGAPPLPPVQKRLVHPSPLAERVEVRWIQVHSRSLRFLRLTLFRRLQSDTIGTILLCPIPCSQKPQQPSQSIVFQLFESNTRIPIPKTGTNRHNKFGRGYPLFSGTNPHFCRSHNEDRPEKGRAKDCAWRLALMEGKAFCLNIKLFCALSRGSQLEVGCVFSPQRLI
jgi:hypothetical protein